MLKYTRLPFLSKRHYATSSLKTELNAFHVKHGGQMVPFCGWDMPVAYSDQGTVSSHLHTREKASIFDVSHMLQLKIVGKHREEFIERVTVADIAALKPQSGAYSLMLNPEGGIIDDLIVSRYEDHIYFVSNAGCAEKDYAHLQHHAQQFTAQGKDVTVERLGGSLVALQGPAAGRALGALVGEALRSVYFMQGRTNLTLAGIPHCRITRCGYTGEDGFEIAVPSAHAEQLVGALLANPEVKLAGLAARDSLRLEAGLALYGNDLTEQISPIEAALLWTISKRRRENPTFIGAERFRHELQHGVHTKRIGLIGTAGRIPRAHNAIALDAEGSQIVGSISSGGYSPCLKVPIAMAYLDKRQIAAPLEEIKTFYAVQPGKASIPMAPTKIPFVKTNYYHAPKPTL